VEVIVGVFAEVPDTVDVAVCECVSVGVPEEVTLSEGENEGVAETEFDAVVDALEVEVLVRVTEGELEFVSFGVTNGVFDVAAIVELAVPELEGV